MMLAALHDLLLNPGQNLRNLIQGLNVSNLQGGHMTDTVLQHLPRLCMPQHETLHLGHLLLQA